MKILTMEGIAVLVVSLIASTWMAGVTSAKIESLSDGIIERVQYSAYSGVPFPNCVETVDDKTVILHWVGSCSDEPYFENMKYYADLGYHGQSTTGNVATNGESETTMVKLGYRSTFEDVLRDLLAKEGVVCPPSLSC